MESEWIKTGVSGSNKYIFGERHAFEVKLMGEMQGDTARGCGTSAPKDLVWLVHFEFGLPPHEVLPRTRNEG